MEFILVIYIFSATKKLISDEKKETSLFYLFIAKTANELCHCWLVLCVSMPFQLTFSNVRICSAATVICGQSKLSATFTYLKIIIDY